jgi:hypothetical protein
MLLLGMHDQCTSQHIYKPHNINETLVYQAIAVAYKRDTEISACHYRHAPICIVFTGSLLQTFIAITRIDLPYPVSFANKSWSMHASEMKHSLIIFP